MAGSWMRLPGSGPTPLLHLTKVGLEPGAFDGGNRGVLIDMRGIPGDPQRPDDRTFVPDDHPTGHRHHLAGRHGSQGYEQGREALDALGHHPARQPHPQRTPRLADGYVDTKKLRPIVPFDDNGMAARVEDGGSEPPGVVLSSPLEDAIGDVVGLL